MARTLAARQSTSGRSTVVFTVTPSLGFPFGLVPENQTILLFQTIQELLTNVVKHAQSDEATVSLNQDMGTLWLEVRDNGAGFDPVAVKKNTENFSKFGLFSIGERMRVLGGTFEVESMPGHGTIARLTLPVNETNVDMTQYSE